VDELVRRLQEMGLTDNEGRAYAILLVDGPMTGYEVAKRTGIARGNVYATLGRLVEKQAVVKSSDDRFAAIPPDQFALLRQEALRSAASESLAELERLQRKDTQAQVISLFGREAVRERCRTMIDGATATIFLAAFPEELSLLAPALLQAQARGVQVEALCFGQPPAGFPAAVTHHGADEILLAQGGRLLMLATWPEGLTAVLDDDQPDCGGIWAWNRYLASTVGLYVAHELFAVRLWANLPDSLQGELIARLGDPSSQIALAGLVPGLPLRVHLTGRLTPGGAEHE